MPRTRLYHRYEPLYEWLCQFFFANHYFPTMREIVAAGFYASTSSASHALNRLVEIGKLNKIDNGTTHTYTLSNLQITIGEHDHGHNQSGRDDQHAGGCAERPSAADEALPGQQ